MVIEYKTIHNKFKLNTIHYGFAELKELGSSLKINGKPFEKEIGDFLLQWQQESAFINLKTSGSTGIPKTIIVSKQAMVNSAIATGSFFNLKPGNKALLCLPANYIAGKMMLVRAMVLGLELDCILPKSILNIDNAIHYHFAAMVPMQLQNNLRQFETIKTIIVGGAKVSRALIYEIKNHKTTFFETYGMTETVSHIAVKQLNNFEGISTSVIQKSYFKILPNITITQDNRNCLVIDAPKVSDEKIITNDVVNLHSKIAFEWLGRFDNIINSGGIKIVPEEIENQLSSKINTRFFIASEKDKTLGERVILIVEGEENHFNTSAFNTLEAFCKPKSIYYLEHFIETASGKIQRLKTLQLLKK